MAVDPITVSAVGSVFSSLASGLFGGGNRSWQQMMSNTAHQREVADLRKAGLNPVLSAMGGNGASTPTGASIDVQNLGADISSAYANKVAKQQADIASDRQKQDKVESDSRIGVNTSTIAKNQEEMLNLITNRQATAENIKLLGAQTANALQQLEVLKKHPELVLAQIGQANSSADLAKANSALSYKNVDYVARQMEKISAEIEGIKEENKRKKVEGKAWETGGNLIDEIQKHFQNRSNDSNIYSGID